MVKVKTFVCSGCNKKFKNQRSKTLHMKSCIYLKYNQELAKDVESGSVMFHAGRICGAWPQIVS